MKLVTWALATFHASTFVLVIVLLAYSRGGLGGALSGLNTFVGLGLFLALWVTTYITTARALADLDLIAPVRDQDGYLRRTLRWGSRNGMAFLAILGVVALFAAVANTRPEAEGTPSRRSSSRGRSRRGRCVSRSAPASTG